MTFTTRELDEALSKTGDGWGTGWNKVYNLYGSESTHDVTVNGEVVKVRKVDEQITSDEQFDTYLIIEVDGKTYRKDGWYASHDGSYWDGGLYEVTKTEVVTYEWKQV